MYTWICNTHNKHHLDRKVPLWSKADEWERRFYQSELDKLLNFEPLPLDQVTYDYIEQINSIIVNVVHVAANTSIPNGKFKHFLKPYWTCNNLKTYHSEQREARKAWISSGRNRNIDNELFRSYKKRSVNFASAKDKMNANGNLTNLLISKKLQNSMSSNFIVL